MSNLSLNTVLGLMNNLSTTNFQEGVVDTDANLTANSNIVLPTQNAVKSYVDKNISGITGGLRYKGVLNASSLGIQLNNCKKGDLYKVSVAGTILTSLVLCVGDMVIANKDVIGTPTLADLDVIDNSEDINNPISIDDSVDIRTLSNGCYVSEGLFSTANGYPFNTSINGHCTIFIIGSDGCKVIMLSCNIFPVFYVRNQYNNSWVNWSQFYNYATITSNRITSYENCYYQNAVNGKQIVTYLCGGTAPTNGVVALKTGLSGNARLLDSDGWIVKNGGTQRIPIQQIVSNISDLSSPVIYQDITSGSIYMQMNNANFNGQSYEVVLYYTK